MFSLLKSNLSAHFVVLSRQMNWHNQDGRTDHFDGSGIKFYYTSVLRPNDLGMLMVGQMGLNIPPGRAEYQETGSCGSRCTSVLKNPIFIVDSHLQMYYHGELLLLQSDHCNANVQHNSNSQRLCVWN